MTTKNKRGVEKMTTKTQEKYSYQFEHAEGIKSEFLKKHKVKIVDESLKVGKTFDIEVYDFGFAMGLLRGGELLKEQEEELKQEHDDYCDLQLNHFVNELQVQKQKFEEFLKINLDNGIEKYRLWEALNNKTSSPDRGSKERLSYGESGTGNLDIVPSNVHEMSVKAVSPTENKQDINRQKGHYSQEDRGSKSKIKEVLK